jgi:hypothetical protein
MMLGNAGDPHVDPNDNAEGSDDGHGDIANREEWIIVKVWRTGTQSLSKGQ